MPTSRMRSVTARDSWNDMIEALPAALSPSVAPVACRLIARADTMGVVSLVTDDGPADFGISRLEQALRGFESVGIGRRLLAPDLDFDLRGGLELLNDEVEHSPTPETEWPTMTAILGSDLIGALCGGLHESTVRRYLRQERRTPDAVAWRLHFLAMVCADLRTGYNSFGVRRWFQRKRAVLDGQAPLHLLRDDWDPDDDGPRAVADLAGRLLTMGAT